MRFAASQNLQTTRATNRRGFTLIEMLISVTLVLLMMVMFAEIFGLASDSMTLQRALADNDQKVRAFTTVMRADLQKRTFQRVVPFHPKESVDVQSELFEPRRGYLYISLNDPANAVDNLLQFTTLTTIRLENSDETPYYGNATGLVSLNPGVGSVAAAENEIRRNSQQPEHDDGELRMNFAAASKAAEIAYYVRGGRLYRRTILVRDPIAVAGSSTPQPRLTWDVSANEPLATPIEYLKHSNTDTTFNGQYAKYDPSQAAGWSYSDDYWADFSYSAYAETIGGFDGAVLLDERSLANDQLTASAENLGVTNGATLSGSPARCFRFGFDHMNGVSREFARADPSDPNFYFIGRYTAEEMSHGDFNFPQNGSTAFGNPATSGDNPMSYTVSPSDANQDGIIDEFAAGPRRGEDLMLSNVHAFEIDVWDDRVGAFVQVGHNLSGPGPDNILGNADDQFGDYHRSRNIQLNQTTPQVVVPSTDSAAWNTAPYDQWTGRIFDTWHRLNDADGDLATPPPPADDKLPPPYRALEYYPPSGSDYYGLGATAVTPTQPLWQARTSPNTYVPGEIVFPATAEPRDFSRYYVCITEGTSPSEPNWSTTPGAVMDSPTPGEARWVVRSNVRPLRAIQIRVRFMHEASGKMRQLSLVHSLYN
ncbi:MAG: prepilin-type N-terminal cleavage/methylation domain-containing protein [Planctomycetota bacterium]|nr:prepilin-type N-terminal cleavage/methylation domain-containing protein [Planctomycetota bacterium]MDA0920463.1 prepilin-type N-terminal cleavage/methylation domain-containing protein [Planctomycetota bacterium]